jgi:hypothetical protein
LVLSNGVVDQVLGASPDTGRPKSTFLKPRLRGTMHLTRERPPQKSVPNESAVLTQRLDLGIGQIDSAEIGHFVEQL